MFYLVVPLPAISGLNLLVAGKRLEITSVGGVFVALLLNCGSASGVATNSSSGS